MIDGFIWLLWHQNKSRRIKKSFCERWIHCFKCLHLSNVSRRGSIQLEFTVESQSTTLKSLKIYLVSKETCNVHNPLQPFVVGKYHFYVIYFTNNWKIASFTVKSFSRLHSMSRDGMSTYARITNSRCFI